jgi:hypothetical protein
VCERVKWKYLFVYLKIHVLQFVGSFGSVFEVTYWWRMAKLKV